VSSPYAFVAGSAWPPSVTLVVSDATGMSTFNAFAPAFSVTPLWRTAIRAERVVRVGRGGDVGARVPLVLVEHVIHAGSPAD